MHPALSVKQVAEFLHVNERTIYRLVGRGELPAFKVAGAWRILEEDMRAWIEDRKCSASPSQRGTEGVIDG